MKKSILSAVLASAFSIPAAFANVDSGLNVKDLNDNYVAITNDSGELVGYAHKESGAVIKRNDDGSTSVVGQAKIKGDNILVTDNNGNYLSTELGSKDENGNSIIINGADLDPVHPIVPPEPEHPIEKPEPENPIERPGIENPIYDMEDAISDAGDQINANAQTTEQNAADIASLEQSFNNFADEVNQKFAEMDERIDGTNASLHAVTNARPMVANGQTAFGVGTGFAGSASAIAVGVAHSFEDTGWSASATVNATTGSYSEVNGGAGLQYAF